MARPLGSKNRRRQQGTHYEIGGVWHIKCECQKCPIDHIFYKAWCDGCARNHMKYDDYVKQHESQPPSKHLAPLNARPKYTKGDNPGHRFKVETARLQTVHRTIHYVDVEAIRQNKYSHFYTSELTLCVRCGLMTYTYPDRRCSGCRHYKPVIKLNHAQSPSLNGPVHKTSSPRRVSDSEEQSMEGPSVNKDRLCQVCRKIHPKDVSCGAAGTAGAT